MAKKKPPTAKMAEENDSIAKKNNHNQKAKNKHQKPPSVRKQYAAVVHGSSAMRTVETPHQGHAGSVLGGTSTNVLRSSSDTCNRYICG